MSQSVRSGLAVWFWLSLPWECTQEVSPGCSYLSFPGVEGFISKLAYSVAADQKSLFLATWVSPQGLLSILTIWYLAFPRVIQWRARQKPWYLVWSSLGNYALPFLQYPNADIGYLHSLWKWLHKAMNIMGQKSMGSFWSLAAAVRHSDIFVTVTKCHTNTHMPKEKETIQITAKIRPFLTFT